MKVNKGIVTTRTAETVCLLRRRKDGQYLSDVWEDWSGDKNYSFTSEIENALDLGLSVEIPKYLFFDSGRAVETAEDLCNYFKGEVIAYKKVVGTQWTPMKRLWGKEELYRVYDDRTDKSVYIGSYSECVNVISLVHDTDEDFPFLWIEKVVVEE